MYFFLRSTRIVRGSDYSPAIALSEDKCLNACKNPNIDLVNDNVYTKFGLILKIVSKKNISDVNQGP